MEHIRLDVGRAFFDFISGKKRKSPGEVVMVILRPGRRVLVHTKQFYPGGQFRLPSGSMKKGELPEEAFRRETKEETGFDTEVRELLGAVHFMFDHEGNRVDYMSYILLSEETTGEPIPEDDGEEITQCMDVSPCDLPLISEELRNQTGDWADWGRFRAPAHDIVHDHLCGYRQEDRPRSD